MPKVSSICLVIAIQYQLVMTKWTDRQTDKTDTTTANTVLTERHAVKRSWFCLRNIQTLQEQTSRSL